MSKKEGREKILPDRVKQSLRKIGAPVITWNWVKIKRPPKEHHQMSGHMIRQYGYKNRDPQGRSEKIDKASSRWENQKMRRHLQILLLENVGSTIRKFSDNFIASSIKRQTEKFKEEPSRTDWSTQVLSEWPRCWNIPYFKKTMVRCQMYHNSVAVH